MPSLGVKECNARDGEERGVVCCRCKAKRSSIALVYSERRVGSESQVQISAPVLQASSLWLSPWGLKRFLFRSPHQQAGGALPITLLPSTLPGQARGAGPTDEKLLQVQSVLMY